MIFRSFEKIMPKVSQNEAQNVSLSLSNFFREAKSLLEESTDVHRYAPEGERSAKEAAVKPFLDQIDSVTTTLGEQFREWDASEQASFWVEQALEFKASFKNTEWETAISECYEENTKPVMETIKTINVNSLATKLESAMEGANVKIPEGLSSRGDVVQVVRGVLGALGRLREKNVENLLTAKESRYLTEFNKFDEENEPLIEAVLSGEIQADIQASAGRSVMKELTNIVDLPTPRGDTFLFAPLVVAVAELQITLRDYLESGGGGELPIENLEAFIDLLKGEEGIFKIVDLIDTRFQASEDKELKGALEDIYLRINESLDTLGIELPLSYLENTDKQLRGTQEEMYARIDTSVGKLEIEPPPSDPDKREKKSRSKRRRKKFKSSRKKRDAPTTNEQFGTEKIKLKGKLQKKLKSKSPRLQLDAALKLAVIDAKTEVSYQSLISDPNQQDSSGSKGQKCIEKLEGFGRETEEGGAKAVKKRLEEIETYVKQLDGKEGNRDMGKIEMRTRFEQAAHKQLKKFFGKQETKDLIKDFKKSLKKASSKKAPGAEGRKKPSRSGSKGSRSMVNK